MSIISAEDLRIYQQANELLPDVYELARKIPEREFRYQIQRAARSIAPLIKEGYAKKESLPEFKRYLRIALGSSDEMQTHLEQANIIYKLEVLDLMTAYKELSKQIQQTLKVWS